MHKNASTHSSTMESQTLTNYSQSKQPDTVASTGARVIAVQANLVTIEAAEAAQRPLTKNEVVCIVRSGKPLSTRSGSRLKCCGCEGGKPTPKCSKVRGA